MKLEEQVAAKGRVQIVLRNEKTGEVTEYDFDNLVVTVGRGYIASRMKDAGLPAQMSHMATGTSNTAAALADTGLAAELSRVALVTAGGTVGSNVVTYVATFGAGIATGALVEAGIFNASSLGTMLCRTVFGVITKDASSSMTITWTVTIT